jgi:nucleotide-binding universal stress UspA family protein
VFTSIVVPVDLEPDGDRALPLAGALATAAGLHLELVTVSSPNMPETADRLDLEERARAVGDDWSVTVLHDNDVVSALYSHLSGRPDCLTVMATRARGALGQRLLGSVAEGLLCRLAQPTLLVGPNVELREQTATPGLLVGVHGDPAGALVPAVARWTQTFDGPTPWLVEVVGTAGAETPAKAELQQLAGQLAEVGVRSEQSVARGRDPASNLIEVADRMADVVVVLVSARWTDPSHLHLSSVARRLTQHSHHPVLIVPAVATSRPGTSDPGRGCPPRRTMPA